MAQYNFEIVYLKGEENTIVDALPRVDHENKCTTIALVFTVTADTDLLEKIKTGYQNDEWCRKLSDNMQSMTEASTQDGLIY